MLPTAQLAAPAVRGMIGRTAPRVAIQRSNHTFVSPTSPLKAQAPASTTVSSSSQQIPPMSNPAAVDFESEQVTNMVEQMMKMRPGQSGRRL
ncbi:hypothetical protein CYLTODRAFT_418990 [Cylindrobasidium torrendii FP15055 ss-10]|uniref:Uncharacterized protein n=1 Tax=Cylindrobasidium torrendii FP15055 ss-10 TaxID=1314674 RepID=A0A0D7BMC5_9AGAR|nr:hypothetical protein CYLTODRAFT_418990 [Cylindrobasidium torrendii FP15055 ss-10]